MQCGTFGRGLPEPSEVMARFLWRAKAPALSHYLLLSLFFFAGLEVAFALQRLVYVVLLVLIAIVVAGVFVIRYEELGEFSVYQTILPSLAALGLAAFALFLPVVWWLHVYLAAAAVCIYYVLKHGAKQAYPTWNTVVSLVTLFVVLASALGTRFHFYIPPAALLIIVFVATAAVAVQFFLRYIEGRAESWLLAVAVALVAAQIAWALQFLPLHYIVQSGIVLTVYYVATGLAAAAYEKKISRREIVEHFAFGTLATITLLLTARWQ